MQLDGVEKGVSQYLAHACSRACNKLFVHSLNPFRTLTSVHRLCLVPFVELHPAMYFNLPYMLYTVRVLARTNAVCGTIYSENILSALCVQTQTFAYMVEK